MTDETERLRFEKVSRSCLRGNFNYHLGTRMSEMIVGEVESLSLTVELNFLINVMAWDRS